MTYFLAIPWILLAGTISHFIISKMSPHLTAPDYLQRERLWSKELFVFLQVAGFTLTPFYEEVFFRGFVQNYFVRIFNPRFGIVIASFIFALAHYKVSYELSNISYILQAFVISLFYGYLYQKTASLKSAIIAHSITNFLVFLATFVDRWFI